MTTVRVRRADSLNWVVEVLVPGGKMRRGKVTSDHWRITGYHPNLRRALLAAPEEALPMGVVTIENLERTVAALLTALELEPGDDRVPIDSRVIQFEVVSTGLPEAS